MAPALMASLWRDLCMAAAREEVYSIALFYGRLAAKAAALAGVLLLPCSASARPSRINLW
ncbi:hypothetical protein CF104_19420 [Aeromonas jandaei]|nr:hypothetical protein RW26_00225 [Aeromonas sp. L_1B5_3]TNH95712.1 hypothetical protein CF104_19420 [Aeromonas jandaei]